LPHAQAALAPFVITLIVARSAERIPKMLKRVFTLRQNHDEFPIRFHPTTENLC
jgi:hypothetical protein